MSTPRIAPPLVKFGVLAAVACGLFLFARKSVPRHDQEHEAAAETEVSVEVGKISLSTLRHYVTAYGTVEPEPAMAGKGPASARIAAPFLGLVADVHCIEGQQVEKGQTLLTLDSRMSDASIELAQGLLAAAEQNYQQQEKSLKQEGIPLWLYSKARQERDMAKGDLAHLLAQQPLLKITAPLSGTVVGLNVRPGEVADPEIPTPLVVLVDLNRLVVAANVPSSQLPSVKLGQSVEIIPQQPTAPAPSAETGDEPANITHTPLIGKVTLIDHQVDPKTDMGSVDVSLPPDARLHPGQFVRARIITDERRDCLTVPSRSVVKNEGGEWVISLVTGKWAVQQAVKVGFREGDNIEVHSLILQPGDQVVTTGAYGLPEKTKIRVLNE